MLGSNYKYIKRSYQSHIYLFARPSKFCKIQNFGYIINLVLVKKQRSNNFGGKVFAVKLFVVNLREMNLTKHFYKFISGAILSRMTLVLGGGEGMGLKSHFRSCSIQQQRLHNLRISQKLVVTFDTFCSSLPNKMSFHS